MKKFHYKGAETDRHSHDLLVRVFKPCKRLAAPEGIQSIKCVGGSVYFLTHTRRAAIIMKTNRLISLVSKTVRWRYMKVT